MKQFIHEEMIKCAEVILGCMTDLRHPQEAMDLFGLGKNEEIYLKHS